MVAREVAASCWAPRGCWTSPPRSSRRPWTAPSARRASSAPSGAAAAETHDALFSRRRRRRVLRRAERGPRDRAHARVGGARARRQHPDAGGDAPARDRAPAPRRSRAARGRRPRPARPRSSWRSGRPPRGRMALAPDRRAALTRIALALGLGSALLVVALLVAQAGGGGERPERVRAGGRRREPGRQGRVETRTPGISSTWALVVAAVCGLGLALVSWRWSPTRLR